MTAETTQQEGTPGAEADGVTVSSLRFEHQPAALGIGTDRPRLSWTVATDRPDWWQAGYEITAWGADGVERGATGLVESDQSVLVPWPFAPLQSRERCTVRVRVRGTDGSASAWSAPAPVEAGLLQPADWFARFVTPDWDEDTPTPPAPLLRREFTVRPGVAAARLYVTALGVYEAVLNGATVGDQVMAPGWTSYHHRLRYQTFDVTALLHEGPNVIGAMLGDGWYRGRLLWGAGLRNIYGDRLALLAQLEITYTDGTQERIGTDAAWCAAPGPVVANSIYDGERYDARREQPGWAAPGFDDHAWVGVRPLDHDLGTLVAPTGPPVRRTELLAPVAITTAPTGRTLVDFGQNLVGRLRITVQGTAGQTVTLRHAEVLEDGELGTRPLRAARATDRYTLRGGGVETWEPRFTFHGFRYAEIDGPPGVLDPATIRAVVCHSDLERTGWFTCSDPLVSRLHENVVWSMRGNFFDIPTDCPQRDERLGWTGDIAVFAPSACFLYDSAGFLQSWLADLAAEQARAGGVVSFVVPNILPGPPTPTAAWGDAAVVVPWVLYQRYGDAGLLAAQFESMRGWVDVVAGLAGERHLWDRGFQFGDWLDPAAPPERPADALTDPFLLATACFAHSAERVGQAAGVLGRAEDAAHYGALAAQVRAAFAAEYTTPAGRLLSDAPTAYALALEYGLLPEQAQRQNAGARLAELVRASGYHISTGFVGTPLICDALCAAGETDAAFRLLMQRDCPSWLYPVTMGATTIWERWDSMLPDGSINPGQMTSFNHYALGAVADWLHRTVGGLAPAEPGYRRLAVQPQPGGGLTHATARHQTPYGLAACAWAIADGQITVEVLVPPNTTARVTLPGHDAAPVTVGSGIHRWAYPYVIPAAARPRLTLDNQFGEIVDDAEAWAAVLPVIRRYMPDAVGGEVGWKGALYMPMRQAFAMRPQAEALLEDIAAVLAGLGR